LKTTTIKQIFDELADRVSPEHRASWERLGRRLELLDPDDEILQILWFLLMHTDICVNALKSVSQQQLRLEANMKADRELMSELQKWMKILFSLIIGLSILLGIFVDLFEFILKHVPELQ